MNQRIFFLGLLAFTLLFSCQENSDATNERPTDHFGNTFSTPFDGIDAFLNYQAKIEKRKDLQKLNSLLFTQNNGNTFQSVAFLEKNGDIAKAQLNATRNNGQQIQYTFYFLKGVLSMAYVQYNQISKNIAYSVFFDAAQSPIATYMHRVVDAETPSAQPLTLCKAQPWLNKAIENSLQLLSDMQNQAGIFELHFLGFNEAFNKKFIEFGNANFSTNLAFVEQETLVQQIKKTPQAYQSKTFHLQFVEITEASGFSYQLLTELIMNH